MQKNTQWQCRWSPTLGELEATHQEIWGTSDYEDINAPTVFFGCYGLPDFMAIRQHKGRKAILWAGTDILHLRDGYWIDEVGNFKVEPIAFCDYLNTLENWVENEAEQNELKKLGIESKVCPSFLGDVNKFEVSFKWSDRPKVYLSCSGDEFKKYKWNLIEKIADKCNVIFYLYGNKSEWKTRHKNVIIRGRINKEIMNEEVSEMQAGLRPLKFDGCSEVVVKSLLQGQHTISRIRYPFVDSYKTEKELINLLNNLKNKKKPNLRARNYFIKNLNNYPWNYNAKIAPNN